MQRSLEKCRRFDDVLGIYLIWIDTMQYHQNARQLCLALFLTIFVPCSFSFAGDGPAASPEKEAELIAVLQSESPAAEKAIACKNLAIYGSGKAVPELAKLLGSEQLSSWSRIALEVIPGSEADEALRKATDSLEGLLLVGTINSIGVRRDSSAVDLLTAKLQSPDAEVASAAAVALGRIGSSAASQSLQAVLATAPLNVRSAVAEGCVLCAERFHTAGLEAEAVALYDLVRKSDVPEQRILEATRGAILTRKQQGIALLIEQLKSPSKGLFYIALSTAREFPGGEIDEALATEMAKATPDRAALIIGAMADRTETVSLPAILKVAKSGPKPVRLAALHALGRVGNAASLSPLLESAIETDPEIAQVAHKGLTEISGESIDKEIVTRLAKPDGKVYRLLIELVGERRIDALPALLKALDNSDKAVRSAALTSLGNTVPADKLGVLIKQVVTPKSADDAVLAQQALKTACVRMPDRDACSTELATAMERTPVATKIALLKILGAVSGPKALSTIAAAAKNNDPQLQDVASELLGDWMTIDAAPVLLDLAKTAPAEKFQIRAMRGYIKAARQFTMAEPERIEMIQRATEASRRTAEKKLVVEVLKRYPNLETLKLAVKAVQDPELKDEASQAALVIALKIGDKSPEVRELLSTVELSKVKLEIIKAEYGAGAAQKDVTEILQKHATDIPLITLPSGSYNECFGGDPAPSTAKQLKIQYKINDKLGEVALVENSLIILPVPKEKK
jgi:HEAT repeat protein